MYLLIALSQLILRRRTPVDRLIVRMWFYPFLTVAVALAIVAILASMFADPTTRSQILLSLGSWAVVLGHSVTRWRGGSVDAQPGAGEDAPAAGSDATATAPTRVLGGQRDCRRT